MIGVLLSHAVQILNITVESGIIMIGVLLSHEIRINITLESVSILINMLLEEKKSNERAV